MKTAEEKTLDEYKAHRLALVQELDLLNNLISLMESRISVYGSCISSDSPKKTNFDCLNINKSIKGIYGGGIKKSISMKFPLYTKGNSVEEFFNTNGLLAVSYKQGMTYNEKILFVLKRLNSATIYDMIEMLKIYEKPEDEEKLFSGLTMAASAMNVKGEIFAQKEGRRNRYSLEPFDEVKDESLLKFMSMDINKNIDLTINYKDEDGIF